MDIVEADIMKNMTPVREVSSSEVDEKEGVVNTYTSVEVNSFARAVEEIVLSNPEDSLCMIDFDRTFTGKGYDQVRNPQIEDEVKRSFPLLARSLKKGAVCIATNRTEGTGFLDRAIFKTDRANKVLDSFLEDLKVSSSVKVFRDLNKQIANYPGGDRELLVDHLVGYIKDNDMRGRINLFMIEDDCFLALDRSIFPNEIAEKVRRKVKEDLGRDIGIDVIDFVLKR